MPMLWFSPRKLAMLLEILADYLHLAGGDADRKARTAAARKLLKSMGGYSNG